MSGDDFQMMDSHICTAELHVTTPAELPWLCSLDVGHDGNHQATIPNGQVLAEWDSEHPLSWISTSIDDDFSVAAIQKRYKGFHR